MFKWIIRKKARRALAELKAPVKKVAVMIPLPNARLSQDESISMRHLRKYLGDHEKFLLVPEGMKVSMDGFSVKELSREHFGSAANHNRMLYRTDFWEMFSEFEYVLMYHLDALIFSDQLMEWCEKDLDFVGSPFIHCKDTPWVKTERVGNGGFALYRIPSVLKVLWGRYREEPSKYYEDHFWKYIELQQNLLRPLRAAVPKWLRGRATAPLQKKLKQMDHIEVNEHGNDLFWSDDAVRFFPDFKVASLDEGLAFAFEVVPRECLERTGGKLPFGCHAFGRYDREFWEHYILPPSDQVEAEQLPLQSA